MGHNSDHSHSKPPAMTAGKMAVILGLLFLLTAAGHTAFVKDGDKHGQAAGSHGPEITVYATQAECEADTGGTCFLKVCDEMTAQGGNEDICGQGYNREGWYPGKDAAHDTGAAPAAH